MFPTGSLDGETAPGRSRPRRIALGLGLALAALAALYVVFWVHLAGRFGEGVRAFLAERPGEGFSVAYASIALGGFPARIEARLLAPSATVEGAGRAWIWRPAQVAFSARPWSAERVTLDLSGEHAVIPADASGLPRWKGRARILKVEALLAGAAVAALAVHGAEIRIDGRGVGEEFALGRLRADWRRTKAAPAAPLPESQSFEALAEDIRLPPAGRLPLGDEIARLAVAGEVKGRLAPDAAGALGRWRDDGGTVELARIEARYGALALAGEGTLALDAAFQPVGAFTARIEGYSETLDALRDAGAMTSRNALAAKVVLTALARRDGEGRPYLTIPLALQERRLYAGPVALLTVPALAW